MGRWSIRVRIVLVIAIGVVVALGATIALVEQNLHDQSADAAQAALAASHRSFEELKARDTSMLSAVLDTLMTRSDLRSALAARDVPALKRLSAPLFADLKSRYGITHLYFISPDGHVLLRAHQPSQAGDLVTRQTFRVAQRTGGYGTGLELGKTAYALRVVHAVEQSGAASAGIDPQMRGALIGYLEVGEEIGHFLRLMADQNPGDQYALLLPKGALTHADWASVRQQEALPDDWNALDQWVVAGSTVPSLTAGLELPDDPTQVALTGSELPVTASHSDKQVAGAFPVSDAAGNLNGIVVAVHDMSPTMMAGRSIEQGIVAVIAVMTAILSVVVLTVLNRYVFRPLGRLELAAEAPDALASGLEFSDSAPGDAQRGDDEIERFERALLRSVRELGVKSELLDSVTDVLYVHDADGHIFYANRAASLMLGYSHDELLRMNVRDIVPEGLRPTVRDNIARIIQSGRRIFESNDLRSNGEPVPVEVHAQAIDIDGRTYVLSVVRDLTERKKAERTIAQLAYFDPLTTVANRRLFQDRLEAAMAHARRSERPFSVFFLDVDKLKQLNDSLGHEIGDAVLREVARRLHALVREMDTVARLGGDEFALLLVDADEHIAAEIGARLTEVMETPISADSRTLRVSLSAGVAVWEPEDDADSVLRKADIAMYHAKEAGQGHLSTFDGSMLERMSERVAVQAALRAALDSGLLELHYQPQVDIRDGSVCAAEALARWDDPEHGVVPPSVFVEVAEQTGLIVELGRWAIDRAVSDLRDWHDRGLTELRVAVNVSASQFADDDLPGLVAHTLEEYGVAGQFLSIEITEGVALSGSAAVREAMQSLTELGVQLVIDDFGVGYSALDSIADSPIGAIKIDRSFVARLGTGTERDAIVRTIVDLGRHLRLETIAEGVEDEAQVEALREMGCHMAQGYLYARAMRSGDFIDFARSRPSTPKQL